jgi:uncharacterized membrane protein YphA (DoxX/SURF4 family)
MVFLPENWNPNHWDPNIRLLYAIVALRVCVGLLFLYMGYTHWDDPNLTMSLSSQWMDWTEKNPLFLLHDVYRWIIIPNAGVFAKGQVALEWAAGLMISLGLWHQVGIILGACWVSMHILLLAHKDIPYLNAALLGLLLVALVLWLADAGRWAGMDANRLTRVEHHQVV